MPDVRRAVATPTGPNRPKLTQKTGSNEEHRRQDWHNLGTRIRRSVSGPCHRKAWTRRNRPTARTPASSGRFAHAGGAHKRAA